MPLDVVGLDFPFKSQLEFLLEWNAFPKHGEQSLYFDFGPSTLDNKMFKCVGAASIQLRQHCRRSSCLFKMGVQRFKLCSEHAEDACLLRFESGVPVRQSSAKAKRMKVCQKWLTNTGKDGSCAYSDKDLLNYGVLKACRTKKARTNLLGWRQLRMGAIPHVSHGQNSLYAILVNGLLGLVEGVLTYFLMWSHRQAGDNLRIAPRVRQRKDPVIEIAEIPTYWRPH